jgi:HPt (histidine-containing phosphotransfer) domain-containing protein
VLRKPFDSAALEAACLAALGGAPAEASADDPLAALPGVDASIGRAATRGNDQLYRRLLLLFLKTQRDFPARFAAAQANPDATSATRYAHDLKATAGSLGMTGLQQIAADLEAACLDGAPPAELVDAVHATLVPILAGLERLAPP